MDNIEFLHFQQLKEAIQTEYLKEHAPTFDEIAKWKGIDIIYFQEDLRKKAKGNISEKTFYTYFKSSQIEKLPRIDMLNLLAIYVGYLSWADFKKQNPIEINQKEEEKLAPIEEKVALVNPPEPVQKNFFQRYKVHLLGSGIALLLLILGISLKYFWKTTYTFCFTDADRGTKIQNIIDIKVIKENESPIHYQVKAGECFQISTQDKILRMEVSTPLYEKVEIFRNLENAPEVEQISLKPDDYALMLYYYSTKDTNNTSLEQIKNRQQKLHHLISENALIYQVFDNEIYGIETLTKQKYIGLVTTPTKSFKNLKVLSTKMENGKITSIKFKIESNEK